MLRKLIKIVLGATILLALFLFVVFPMLVNTEKGRQQLAKMLGKALDRPVKIEGLKVGWFFSSVDIEGFSVGNPPGFPEGNMIEARQMHMESSIKKLLGGTIRGALAGQGLTVHMIRKGGQTNFDGLGGKRKEREKTEGEIPDLDLQLDLKDGRFIIEDLDKAEKLDVKKVSTSLRFTNMAGAKTADLVVTVAEVDNNAMKVRDLVLTMELAKEDLVIRELSAILPGKGTLAGDGAVQLRKGGGWQANLRMASVSIDGDMMPFVGAVYPMAAAAGGQMDGLLDATFSVKGNGLTWKKIKPNLTGTGDVKLSKLGLPAGSVVGQLTALAGGSAEKISFNNAGAQFKIQNGWLHFNRLSASGKEARYDLAGMVSLNGELRLSMDILPLVKTFGGESRYAKVQKYVKTLPVRIQGTTLKPELKAPDVNDLIKDNAGGLLEKGIEKGLGKLFDKDKKK